MPQPKFRVVDSEREHPRDLAKRKVKQFRTLVEQEKFAVCNQICTGAPSLRVDEILRRSQSDHLGKK